MKETKLRNRIAASSLPLKGVFVAYDSQKKIIAVVQSDDARKKMIDLPDFVSFDVTNVGLIGDNYKFFNKTITENAVDYFYSLYSDRIQKGDFYISNDEDDIFYNRLNNTVRLFLKFSGIKKRLILDLEVYDLFDSMSNVDDYDLCEKTGEIGTTKGEVRFLIDGDKYKSSALYFFNYHVHRKDLRRAVKYYDNRQQQRSKIVKQKNNNDLEDEKNQAA